MAISNPASAVFVIHIGCILLSKASCLDEFFFGYILCELHCPSSYLVLGFRVSKL